MASEANMQTEPGDNMADSMADDVTTGQNGHTTNIADKYKIPLVFMKESSLFGNRKPDKNEWLFHVEMYEAVGRRIDASHIKGLQRVRGYWRIYVDCIPDKVILMAEGVPLRGKVVPVLNTNPERLDGEQTTRVRVKNIPLSVDDGIIQRALTLKEIEVISLYREKLRINSKLTDCETGDRVVIVKSSTLKSPLSNFMTFGKYTGRVVHPGQPTRSNPLKQPTCHKCLIEGHRIAECPNDWVCTSCGDSGHKRADCTAFDRDPDSEASSVAEESDSDNQESDENVDSGDDTLTHDDNRSASSTGTPSQDARASSKDHERQPRPAVKLSGNAMAQVSMAKYLTPDKERQSKSRERSPTTPTEVLHDKQLTNNTKKPKKPKKK